MSNDNSALYKSDWKLRFSARQVCQGMCHVTYNWRANRYIHKMAMEPRETAAFSEHLGYGNQTSCICTRLQCLEYSYVVMTK